MYNGIPMRSRLEADYAKHLDTAGLEGRWRYEGECFASPQGQWLPDFRVTYPNGLLDLIELKPAGLLSDHWMDHEIDKILARMTIAWSTDPSASLTLVYWNHGGSAEMVITGSAQGSPWIAKCARLPLLWTGMGQYERCLTEG